MWLRFVLRQDETSADRILKLFTLRRGISRDAFIDVMGTKPPIVREPQDLTGSVVIIPEGKPRRTYGAPRANTVPGPDG